MKYKKISELKSENIEGKTFFVRAGLNVPIFEGKIENDFRLKKVLDTLDFLIEKKAKIILAGHVGMEESGDFILIFEWFKKKYQKKVFFDEKTFVDFDPKKVFKKVLNLKNGEVLLLDNLRATKKEKENSVRLAKDISDISDFYINEAFSVSHREHMSVGELPKNFPEGKIFIGFQFQKELKNIDKIKNIKNKKSVFVLGGSKISTKIPMLEKMLESFDLIILGGAIANSFYKKLGYEIGKSFTEEEFVFEENLFEKIMSCPKVFLPNIVFTENGEKEISGVKKDERILDSSPNAFVEIEHFLSEAEFVFFNGPVGFYEGGYKKGTKFLLESLAGDSRYFVVGGGNTVSVVFELGLEKKIDFISTGGGSLMKKLSD
jgi:phosphoglycerate kinase